MAKQTKQASHIGIKPLQDRVVLKRLEEEEDTKGGIIIPDTAREKPMQAEVMAVGPGKLTEEGNRIAPELKEGQRVFVGKYTGTEIELDGVEYVIAREEDVLGILE